MTTILSGAQLVNTHSKSDHELPCAGVKEFQPTHSWLESKQVQNALDQRKTLLEEERVEKWNNLMKAEWMPPKHKAEVKTKSKHWEVFGHHSDNADWLFPEEALLLMEMNCLECLYSEVPLSVQKGYTVLLHPEHGCSLNEYRVYAHLCRTGYRVVRHTPDLTVTAYEKQIRLDQHLEQRKTYSDTTSAEPDLPRPNLPPKKIVDLPENTEIKIESGNAPLKSLTPLTENILMVDKRDGIEDITLKKQQAPKHIEVIDILDSSSDSGESSSDDSIIEIVHEYVPISKSIKDVPKENVNNNGGNYNDDDNDIEIIEVSIPKKEIIVATVESSDSEKEHENSDSESEKSYDGNWKRSHQNRRKSKFVRPPSMENFTFSAVDEFCVNKSLSLELNRDDLHPVNEGNEEKETSNMDDDISNPISGMQIEPPSRKRTQPLFPVNKTRTEILNFMPTMAGINTKLLTLETPDLRLIPASITPKHKMYTFNTNTLRARVFSLYRSGFRGRRNFHGPRFNSYNPYYSSFPNQLNVNNHLPQALPLQHMFGSDIQSMARGMMQFASALLLNIPQNNQTSTIMPYSSQQNFPFSNSNNSQSNFSSQPLFNDSSRCFTTPTHIRFSDSSFTSGSPPRMVTNDSLNRSFRSDYSRNSGNRNDFHSSERTFTPPIGRGHERQFNSSFNHTRKTRGRNYQSRSGRFTPSPRNFKAVDPPRVDPAYIKSDVPLAEEKIINLGVSGDFIPLSSANQEQLEIIDIADNDDSFPPNKQRGISNRFNRKRKKRLGQQMSKRGCHNNQPTIKKDPVIVFLDSSNISSQSIEAIPLKQESNAVSNVNIKCEDLSDQTSSIKQEISEDNSLVGVKMESIDNNSIKVENNIVSGQEGVVKSEINNEVRVNIGQNISGTNLQIEIKIDNSNDVSLTSLVKAEPGMIVKTEPDSSSELQSVANVKTEPKVQNAEVKIEHFDERIDLKEGIIQHDIPHLEPVEVSSSTSIIVDTCGMECETEERNEPEKDLLGHIDSCSNAPKTIAKEYTSLRNLEHESEMDVEMIEEDNVINASSTKQAINCELLKKNETPVNVQSETSSEGKITNDCSEEKENERSSDKLSSWADVKKYNVPLTSSQENRVDEEPNENEDNDEIHPLIRPKHCKTIGTVLTALQIFSPFSPVVPDSISKLKISFDMYLPADFRKSRRGLPHYRIVVFEGKESLPSSAQIHELQTRFQDSVPVLRAVVMPDSVVFYSCTSISLPVDLASYKEC